MGGIFQRIFHFHDWKEKKHVTWVFFVMNNNLIECTPAEEDDLSNRWTLPGPQAPQKNILAHDLPQISALRAAWIPSLTWKNPNAQHGAASQDLFRDSYNMKGPKVATPFEGRRFATCNFFEFDIFGDTLVKKTTCCVFFWKKIVHVTVFSLGRFFVKHERKLSQDLQVT